MPNLIIILGVSASGKTSISKSIANKTGLPLVSRDCIKEIIFDEAGWKDRKWSMTVGRAGFSIVDYIVEEQLKNGNSLIVESPFNPQFENAKFQKWQKLYNVNIVQILCHADTDVLIKRFEERSLSSERHPGHVDSGNIEEFRENISKTNGKAQTLDVKSKIIEIDTSDFNKVDLDLLISKVKNVLD